MLVVGDCSGEACAVPAGSLPYGAAPAGNAVVLAAVVALLLPVSYAGLRYKTHLHSALLVAALLVEVGGHVGRIFLTADPASHASSAVYLMGTHWGAVLVGSAANLVLPHVMVLYGEEFQLVSDPVYLSFFFFVLDIFMLAFQSVGIGFASTANTATEVAQGVGILLAGLAIQAISLLTFLGTYRYFRYRLAHRRYILDERFSLVYTSRRFKNFMICVQVAAWLLMVRTAVRIAIFASGLTSAFARSQVAAFLLDDALVLVALLIFTVCPAGRAFGVAAWAATSPIASSSSSDRPDDLPLRRRRHRRNRSYPINKRIISLPYPSPSSTSPRFSPGSASRAAGMTPGLPAHPSPQGVPPPPVPPLMSPRNYPVHQRVPHDASPTHAVPFLAAQDSPGLDSTMWATAPVEHGRKRKMWGGSGPEGNQLVDSDALW
ncbi:RTA1 like protein-domain-containing protein [Chaetomium strumarium]|uniref:RTA1 like protein-domain-containing protein n=1 Tax=Chaetomium strumarium TaxID=1170767 RepID=A0AAJ0M1B7_9PEZI|nr:RTA1 like protein-domain-containing protein [Chaetomium strumarium]